MRIISLFFPLFLFADIIIYTPFSKEINNTIYAKNPYIIYKDFFIQSKKAIIKNKKAIFEGDVVIFYKDEILKVDKVEVVSKDNIKLQKSFIYDRENDFWFLNKKAVIKNKIIYFKDTIFSSCCIKNPDWFLYIRSGKYNIKTKTLRIYNLTLYIRNTPVFYFPFYLSSFNRERRSGFLRPYLGFSIKEGILYSQPIYFATSIRTDLEITPTIRTKRGRGIYTTFRFVDSPYSFGTIKIGEFIDFDKFYKKYDLAHKKHFGYQFEYKRDKIFGKDKLYANIQYANDVDYFYLNPYNYTFNTSYLTDKIITSKINYIKYNEKYLFGVYNRYYIDTSLLSNKSTIQTVPQVNFHIFENIYKKWILYSFDYNYYNYFNAYERYFVNTFNFPVGVSFHFFDNYLNLKISENFQGEYANYYNSSLPPSYIFNGFTEFKLFTSLTRKEKFLHIISPSIIFTKKNFSKEKNTSNIIKSTVINDNLSFNLFEIFEYKNLSLTHTLHQILLKRDSELENQIKIKYKNYSIIENNKFKWDLKRTQYNAFTFNVKGDFYQFSLSHIYQFMPSSKAINISISNKLNKYKTFYFKYNYDLINKYAKFIKFGVKLNKKCFYYNLSISKSTIPVLKENGISYNKDYILNISVNFYPIGGLNQSFLVK